MTPSVRFHALALAFGAAASALAPRFAVAQTPRPSQGTVLSLADALTLARRNNPTLQNAVNARRTAAASVRA
ncbi:MAG: hypothetical protein LXA09_12360, partial [Gemmatimonadetes bacterium]|nr:hypothetical protein [Gemmatimonadota bacterium]